mgnify:CR=1 FL=1
MNRINNTVNRSGNLGMDPEIKSLESGKTLARFSLATSSYYKNAAGEKIKMHNGITLLHGVKRLK